MKIDKVHIPRKLKKAVKRIIVERALSLVHTNTDLTSFVVTYGDRITLLYGKHNKWTQLAVCKIRNEIREMNKRMAQRMLFKNN